MIINGQPVVKEIEIVNPFSPRKITHAFHDIDGTHSLIREWVPVMTLVTGYVAQYGLPEGNMDASVRQVINHRDQDFSEAHRFAIESAGLSALTQMEWAIRSGVKNGTITGFEVDHKINAEIIQLIWQGHEIFDDYEESQQYRHFLADQTPKLFKIYEKVLLLMCRNENLADARINQEKWRVPGSMEFLEFLRNNKVKNYFVTGAVVEHGGTGIPSGTMYEEITALGYEVGTEKLVANLYGSSWNEKIPKEEIMRRICVNETIDPSNVLIVGDGRSEIAAGVSMGAITISRLDSDATRAREIHRALRTNIIVEEYNLKKLRRIFIQ